MIPLKKRYFKAFVCTLYSYSCLEFLKTIGIFEQPTDNDNNDDDIETKKKIIKQPAIPHEEM